MPDDEKFNEFTTRMQTTLQAISKLMDLVVDPFQGDGEKGEPYVAFSIDVTVFRCEEARAMCYSNLDLEGLAKYHEDQRRLCLNRLGAKDEGRPALWVPGSDARN